MTVRRAEYRAQLAAYVPISAERGPDVRGMATWLFGDKVVLIELPPVDARTGGWAARWYRARVDSRYLGRCPICRAAATGTTNEFEHEVECPVGNRDAPRLESGQPPWLSTANILDKIREWDIEPDQALSAALELAGGMTDSDIKDEHLFVALYRLNTLTTRNIDLDLEGLQRTFVARGHLGELATDRLVAADRTRWESQIGDRILLTAMASAGSGRTLTSRQVVRAILDDTARRGDNFDKRPYTVDMLAEYFGYPRTTPLSSMPTVQRLLAALEQDPDTPEDFQYVLFMDGGSIGFRVVSRLGDYVEQTRTGLLVPHRALLTHFKDRFGGFTEDEIQELEDLLNSRTARERDFQGFFERHPHFFRRWDYREVHSQVHLVRPGEPLIPDFILTDREAQRATVLELKLPGPQLIRRQQNRDRFAASVMEARSQLLRYRDWFRVPSNRALVKDLVGMEIYEPHLAVIIGRSSEFRDAIDRQTLTADHPDIEVVTYDDMLTFASRRRLIIQPGL